MNKKWKISKKQLFLSIISIILGWIALTNEIMLIKYNILPFKYILLTFILIIVIPAIVIMFMLRKKTKPKIKIFLSIVSTIFIIALSILLVFLNRTFSFLNNISDNNYKIENYLVLVLNDGSYNEITDLENKKVGYISSDTSKIDEALVRLDNIIETDKDEQENYDVLVNKLYNKELDGILIEESYKNIINDNITDFENKTKVIYTIDIQKEMEIIVKNVDVKSDAFNVYISGIDTYGNISSVARSDVNIVATINPTTHQILLISIPRDYYVELDGTGGSKDKLTHAGIYGIDTSVKTLEKLLDTDINYYIKVNFTSVEQLVDTLGGVDVYSEYEFIGFFNSSFKRGFNRVNGAQALEFARTRKTVPGGDRTRGINQQALISAMINKACSKDIIMKYSSILKTLEGSFETNMPTDKITDLIKKQIDEMKSWNVTSISLDGSDGYAYTYSYSHQQLYVMMPDEDTVEEAKSKIKQVQNNENLENSYVQNTGGVNVPITIALPEETEPVEEEQPQDIKEEENNEQVEENNIETNEEDENNNEEEKEQEEEQIEPDEQDDENVLEEETEEIVKNEEIEQKSA